MKNRIVALLFILCVCAVLLSCKKNINITYELNGGVMTDETIKIGSGETLAKPEKEGCLFVGWLDDDKIVESLDKKEYTLKAMWVENPEYDYIDDEDIFMQDELVYYVYLMRNGCSWCEKIKEDVLRYQYKTKLNDKLEKIYVVNLQNEKKSSLILRTYNNEVDDGFMVKGVHKWDDLYIPSTPTLLEIRESNDSRDVRLVANGATLIKEALLNTLYRNEDMSQTTDIYTITYDLDGGTCNNLISKFNKWQKITLPMPQKEGFYFGGWVENDTYVKLIDNKNHSIKATWVEDASLESLDEKDIFSLDGTYYIYFLKVSDDNSEALNDLKQYNALSSYYETGRVYYVDLEKCEVIYRAYVGEDGTTYKADGASSIDELYISKKKSMIMIDNHKASFVADSYKEIKEYLEDLLNVSLSD